jgi:PKD domain
MTQRQRLLAMLVLLAGLACGSDGGTTPPVSPHSDAGPDQIVEPHTVVHLDGSHSSDPQGRPLTYHWSIAAAPTGSTASIADPNLSMTTITPDLEGIYDIFLVVSAGNEQEGSTMHILAQGADAGTGADAGL